MSKPIGVEGIWITDMSFQWAEFSQAALAAGQAAAEATATPKASLGTCQEMFLQRKSDQNIAWRPWLLLSF